MMKRGLRMLLLILFLVKVMGIKAQTYNFPIVSSPPGCTYTYQIDITVHLDSVGITNVYFDDGTTGSFAFEAFVSYGNTFSNSTLPTGNFYTYDITIFSDNPNLSSPSLTNNIGSVPLETNSAGGLQSQNNPTYIGSASAMGLSQGQYYSSPGLLAQLGYDSAIIHVNLPCTDTVFLANSTIPLPLLWSRLTAITISNEVSLNWQTFIETNNTGFYVERSTDGKHWNTVAILPGKAKGGNSNTLLSYSFKTKEMIAGHYYYRVSQSKAGEEAIRSNVVDVTISDPLHNIVAYPNPVKNELYIAGVQEQSEYVIINFSGKVVLRGKYNKKIDITSLSPGVYWIECEKQNVKVIINSGGN